MGAEVMAKNALNDVILHLRQAALLREDSGLTDAELLECYVARRDEAAFEALVRRHGPMVLGVCRRILRNEADAEDAFQATFLVLVRKAGAIKCRSQFSNWLYGVAHNTALKARAMIHKRRIKEREAGTASKRDEAREVSQVEVMLDAELSQLPDKYRVPLVLCELEGKTIKDAARQLGWPQGTLATRLARGRALLAKRLSKHGLKLAGGILAAQLSQNAGAACVPVSLVSATVKAATALAAGGAATSVVSAEVAAITEGVLTTMLLSKLKTAAVVVLVCASLVSGAGALWQRTVVAQQPGEKLPVHEDLNILADPIAGNVASPTAQEKTVAPDLKALAGGKGGTVPADVTLKWVEDAKGKPALKVQSKNNHRVILLDRIEFTNGVIEFDALGQSGPAKSNFLGFAFRVVDAVTHDAVFFRPFNFRAEDAERKAYAVQYVSQPKYPWQVLRQHKPGQYEKPIVPAPDGDAWFHVRIVVEKPKVSVYVNDGKEPSLVVEELSDRQGGGVGLWVGPGQGGYFANLKITPAK
jgi:RNA polymerase sigma factor (sigma-70 family)